MKLYVVLGGVDYEGYFAPLLITDRLEKAEACAKKNDSCHDSIDIKEYELNEER